MQKPLFLLTLTLILLTVTKAQNVGIGTIDPINRLHVKQNIANKAIEWEHESLPDNWTIGIGTNTFNCRFEYNGTLKGSISSIDGTFIVGSDVRLKEEIELVPQLLNKILQLKTYKYYFTDTRHLAKNKSIGFIAQDVEKIFPEMVYDLDGGLKGINYAGFAVVAIKAIQEQEEYIRQQQLNISEQQKAIVNLENRLLTLETAMANLSK